MKDIEGIKVLDSDSSKFSWLYVHDKVVSDKIERYRNPEFPNNYINHIKENMNDAHYLFVSSHENVRRAMKEAGIPYVLVYPKRDMLAEIVGRCYLRGNNEKFIKTLIDNWNNWLYSCENDTGAKDKIIIGNNQYLLDVIEFKGRQPPACGVIDKEVWDELGILLAKHEIRYDSSCSLRSVKDETNDYDGSVFDKHVWIHFTIPDYFEDLKNWDK